MAGFSRCGLPLGSITRLIKYEMANPKMLPSSRIMINHQMRVEASNTFKPTPSNRSASTTHTTIFNAVLLTTLPLINHRLSLGQAELPSFVVVGSSVAKLLAITRPMSAKNSRREFSRK